MVRMPSRRQVADDAAGDFAAIGDQDLSSALRIPVCFSFFEECLQAFFRFRAGPNTGNSGRGIGDQWLRDGTVANVSNEPLAGCLGGRAARNQIT